MFSRWASTTSPDVEHGQSLNTKPGEHKNELANIGVPYVRRRSEKPSVASLPQLKTSELDGLSMAHGSRTGSERTVSRQSSIYEHGNSVKVESGRTSRSRNIQLADLKNDNNLEHRGRTDDSVLETVLSCPELATGRQFAVEEAVLTLLEGYVRLTAPLRGPDGKLRTTTNDMVKELHDVQVQVKELKSHNEMALNQAHRQAYAMQHEIDCLRDDESKRELMHIDELRSLEKVASQEKDDLIRIHQLEMGKIQEKLEEQQEALERMEDEKLTERAQWESEVQRFQNQLAETVTSLEGKRQKYEARILKMQADHSRLKDQSRSEMTEQRSQMRDQQESAIEALKMTHTHELECERRDAEQRLETLRVQYEDTIKQMKSAFAEFASLKQDVRQQRRSSQVFQDSYDFKPLADHRATIWQLRSTSGAMKRDLVKNQPRGLRDHHIVARFRILADKIEQLSMIIWDIEKEAQWPLPEDHLRQLHPHQNTRKLKLSMVRSSVWTCLYEHIFQSPFYMFGPGGADMNSGWEDIYALKVLPSQWAAKSAEIETKRCEDAKHCLLLLEADSTYETGDGGLKECCDLGVLATVDMIYNMLQKVSNPSEQDRKAVETIVQDALKSWLECCSQTYRLIVDLRTENGNVLLSAPTAISSLNLVRTPDLRRFGALDSNDLLKEEPVKGWIGSIELFPS
ncbi:hypothetical protein ACN47E_001433 [Coniothyrium glycines]